METAKWRLALWRYNLKIWARKREGERIGDLNDTNIAWPVRASGPCGRKVAAYFFTTLGFHAGVFPTFWELVFSWQLLSGVEKACRYVDRTGYQRTTSGLCSKMPRTAIWRLFVHTPIAGATVSDRFSRGCVPLLPRWVFLRCRQGKVKREIKVVGPQNVLSVLFSQEKNGLARTKWCRARKKKNYQKAFVYVDNNIKNNNAVLALVFFLLLYLIHTRWMSSMLQCRLILANPFAIWHASLNKKTAVTRIFVRSCWSAAVAKVLLLFIANLKKKLQKQPFHVEKVTFLSVMWSFFGKVHFGTLKQVNVKGRAQKVQLTLNNYL